MRKSIALTAASVLLLSGCSTVVPAPEVTPVSLKYCALSDQAGFDDDGLNRSVYAALQQLKVQTGAAVAALEVGDKLTAQQGIDRFVAEDCSAVITAGEDLTKLALAAAKKNETIRFVSVGDIINTGDAAPNFVALTFNIYQAAFAAGYLAAEVADTSALPKQRVAILDKLRNAESRKSAAAFTYGVARYNTLTRNDVEVFRISELRGDAVTFLIAGNSSEIGDWVVNSSQEPPRVIGYGRDWYLDSRNSLFKSQILTSVVRNGVIEKVVSAVLAKSATENFDLSNDGVGLISEKEITFPSDFGAALDLIIKDLNNGKVKVG